MSVVTKLTVKEIQQAVIDYGEWKYRECIFVPNLSWGLLPYEADLVILNKNGYLTEIEIKRSWEDFVADFKKDHKHDAPQVYSFSYLIPQSLVTKAREYHDVNNLKFSLFSYDEDGCITRESGFDMSHNPLGRKLFIEERLQVARLGCMRLWETKNIGKRTKHNSRKRANEERRKAIREEWRKEGALILEENLTNEK